MKNKLGDLSQSEMGKYWMINNFDFFSFRAIEYKK